MDEQNTSRHNLTIPASIIIAGVLIAGSIVYVVGKDQTSPPVPTKGVDNAANAAALLTVSADDAVLGDVAASVTIIEYGDYQCPFCGKFFEDVEPGLRDKYIKTGKAKLIFRNFQFLGPESFAAGAAAECARDQNQFWTYHDALYRAEIADGEEHNGNLNRAFFLRLAREAKLDEAVFAQCIDSGTHQAFVKKESEDGRLIGVNATPTTFVNGVMIRGFAPNDPRIEQAIEAALKDK